MPQFLIKKENIKNNLISVTNKSDINHISKVLRLNCGDKINFVDEEEYLYETLILSINKNSIEAEIKSKQISDRKLNTRITLAQSILKAQKQDFLIQKATETGIFEIIPMSTKNTVVKISSQKDKDEKLEKWNKIALETCKQCERANLPKIEKIISLKELLAEDEYDIRFFCNEREDGYTIRDFLRENKKNLKENSNILLIIGPEGGWDKEELELFRKDKIESVSLGKLILRAETAAVCAISDIIYEYEFK